MTESLRDVRYAWRPGVAERLDHYVYLLVDPRDHDVFYVGKGVGGRCFAHVAEARTTTADAKGDYEKLATIRGVEASGEEVLIEILRHGLDEEAAFAVEAAAIDLLGIVDLTNRQAGRATQTLGRMGVTDINALYGAREAEFDPDHRVVLIRVARAFSPGIDDEALYEGTRRWWRVAKRRRELGSDSAPDWAMAVYQGIVRAVYRIEAWGPAPPDKVAEDPRRAQRWGFSGRRDRQMEDRYLLSDVTAWLPPGAQNPIKYVNC